MMTEKILLVHESASRFKLLDVAIEIRPARIGWRVIVTHKGITGDERWWMLRSKNAKAKVAELIGNYAQEGFIIATHTTRFGPHWDETRSGS